MNLGLAQPAWLFLLPLALLPWWRPRGTQVLHAALAMLPRDPASRALELGLRAAGSLAIATLLLGLADPQRPEHRVLRMGRGAEILLLLDRSRSMDQGFGGVRPGGGHGPHGRPPGGGMALQGAGGAPDPGRLRGSPAA